MGRANLGAYLPGRHPSGLHLTAGATLGANLLHAVADSVHLIDIHSIFTRFVLGHFATFGLAPAAAPNAIFIALPFVACLSFPLVPRPTTRCAHPSRIQCLRGLTRCAPPPRWRTRRICRAVQKYAWIEMACS